MKLEIRNIDFAYPAAPDKKVLSGVGLSFRPGEITGIIGKTGSGKTTLLQLCAGLLSPDSGQIEIDGSVIDNAKSWRKHRSKIGFVFQFPETQLFEETVFKDVAFGVSRYKNDPGNLENIVSNALKQVGLPHEEFSGRSPLQLSSGEKRRVAIAGIIAFRPEILFLDEPTIGLDRNGTREVESILLQYHKNGKIVCVVSHNMDFIARITDRIIVLSGGKISYNGSKDGLFSDSMLLDELKIEPPEILSISEKLSKKFKVDLTGIYNIEEILGKLDDFKNPVR